MTKTIKAVIKIWDKNGDDESIILAIMNKGDPIKLTRSLMKAPHTHLPTKSEYEESTLKSWGNILRGCHIVDSEGFTYKWDEFELMLRTHSHGFEIINYIEDKKDGKEKKKTHY